MAQSVFMMIPPEFYPEIQGRAPEFSRIPVRVPGSPRNLPKRFRIRSVNGRVMCNLPIRNCVLAAVICAAGAFAQPVQAQPLMLGLRAAQQQVVLQSVPQTPPSAYPVNSQPPSTLILPAGTIITVEASEVLSSNKQRDGDTFVAELQNPLVVDGWVVARPGQNVMGRIASARKAGRIKGTSQLSLELQEVVLVDGRQMPVQS